MSPPTVPEHAVILAAGMGSRLRPLTNELPKPMVSVLGVPILHNALHQLEAAGVRRVTIVVGYRKENILRSCGQAFGNLAIRYSESNSFAHTGSAYSLWLARQALLEGDSLVLEGDVFFERAVLDRVLTSDGPDVAAVAPFEGRMEGSAVTLSPSGHVEEVRLKQTPADASRSSRTLFKTVNIFRFSADSLSRTIVPALDNLVRSEATTSYIEQLLGRLVAGASLKLAAARCDHLKWFEIDNEVDLKTAEARLTTQDLAAIAWLRRSVVAS